MSGFVDGVPLHLIEAFKEESKKLPPKDIQRLGEIQFRMMLTTYAQFVAMTRELVEQHGIVDPGFDELVSAVLEQIMSYELAGAGPFTMPEMVGAAAELQWFIGSVVERLGDVPPPPPVP